MYTTTYRAQFDDVDAAGIVYYPRFFAICHGAFEEFFNVNGPYPYHYLINELKRGFPTVSVNADFKSAFKYGDEIKILVETKKITHSSLECHYRFQRTSDDAEIFFASITTVYVDLIKKRSVALCDELKEIFYRM